MIVREYFTSEIYVKRRIPVEKLKKEFEELFEIRKCEIDLQDKFKFLFGRLQPSEAYNSADISQMFKFLFGRLQL